MLQILTVSFRGLVRGRRPLIIMVLLLVPLLLAAGYVGSTAHPNGSKFSVQVVAELFLPVLLPLAALLFATTTLGGEIEDGTLIYLTLRPIGRLPIVIAKLIAAILVTAVMIEISIALTYAIAGNGSYNGRILGAMLVAGFAGCVVYCSVFLTVGLFLPRRGLIVGFIYVLAWEGAAAGLSTALATLSVSRYVQGTMHAALGTSPVASLQHASPSGIVSLIALALMTCAAIVISTWRLRRVELS